MASPPLSTLSTEAFSCLLANYRHSGLGKCTVLKVTQTWATSLSSVCLSTPFLPGVFIKWLHHIPCPGGWDDELESKAPQSKMLII